MTDLNNNSHGDLLKICRYAIERSCGHVEEIDIERFGTDDLLSYVAKNCSHLRYLRLVKCREISDEGLIEAAKQLPLLEDLDILFSNFTKNSLEVIGKSCPLLKSLKYNIGDNGDNIWYNEDDYEDDYDLDDSDWSAISGLDKRGYFYGLLGLLPSPRENSDHSDHSEDDH
ncbi:hypothetical protein P8452_20518 [Trifolium repens]|nr:hypothetical protein P8452_20518 [Trifolium repens]